MKRGCIFLSHQVKLFHCVMFDDVSSGLSMCGESPGVLPPPGQRGEENHSGGATSEPVSGNVIIQQSNTTLNLYSSSIRFFELETVSIS